MFKGMFAAVTSHSRTASEVREQVELLSSRVSLRQNKGQAQISFSN